MEPGEGNLRLDVNASGTGTRSSFTMNSALRKLVSGQIPEYWDLLDLYRRMATQKSTYMAMSTTEFDAFMTDTTLKIGSGPHGRIAMCFVEWSGIGNQKVVIDWMLIDGPKAAHAFGDRLLESPRSFADRTSISGGIDAAVAQLARAPFDAERRTIDVSGDGTNNAGRDVGQARDEALALGISINGLVILSETPLPWNPEHTNPPGGLAKYYRDNVAGGPASFVLEAKDFNSFGEAIIKKMIAEIADARGRDVPFAR